MTDWGHEWLPKAILYILIQIAVGLAVVRWLVVRAAGEIALPASDLDRRFSRAAAIVGGLILVALVARAWAHTAAVFGIPDALVWENVRLVTLESRWGASWQIQGYVALALAGAALLTRRLRRAWIAYSCATVAFCAAIPLLGHAAGSATRQMLHTFHLLSGAIWLGSLAVLVRLRYRPHRQWAPAARPSLEAGFSPLALTTGMLVGASGVAAACTYLGGIAPLISTDYGRLLLLKVACVGAVLACGWLNWQRVRSGAVPSLAIMSVEVAFALAVVTVTSVLTETEHP